MRKLKQALFSLLIFAVIIEIVIISGAAIHAATVTLPNYPGPGKGHRIVIADAIAPAVSMDMVEAEETANSAGEVFTVTGYCKCVICCGIWSTEHPSRANTSYIQKTASGTIPAEGRTAGSDWTILPAGTVIEIDGLGQRIIEDNGNISGNVIDLYLESHEEARQFGRRKCHVWILE